MKRIPILAILLLAATAGWAGQDDGKLTHVKAIPLAKGPVTHSEALAVLGRTRELLASVLEEPELRKVGLGITSGSSPVSRDEVITALDKLAEATKPYFKFTYPALPVETAALVTKKPSVKDAMVRLVKGGFIGRVDSLLCGPASTVEPMIFGDDVGYFLCRISELTHTPSTKWSPYMQKQGS